MKKILLLAAVCFLCISGPTLGAIVYSGSQNVKLQLSPMSPMAEMTIDVAGQMGASDKWDDFTVNLWYDDSMMGMSRLAIYSGSMMEIGMGGIVGAFDSRLQLPYALNLAAGDIIGPGSSLTSVGWAILHDAGVGQFGAEGAISG